MFKQYTFWKFASLTSASFVQSRIIEVSPFHKTFLKLQPENVPVVSLLATLFLYFFYLKLFMPMQIKTNVASLCQFQHLQTLKYLPVPYI